MIVRKAEVVPFECVVRGYLSGSAWQEYRAPARFAASQLPAGPGRERTDRRRSSPRPPRPSRAMMRMSRSPRWPRRSAGSSPRRCKR